MIRVIWVGAFLFVLTIAAGSLSLAFIKYYDNYDLALLFPTIGVACMFLGEKLLSGMERKMGYDQGGAGSGLLRAIVAAVIVIAVPTMTWGVMHLFSDLIVIGMDAARMPSDSEDILTMFNI